MSSQNSSNSNCFFVSDLHGNMGWYEKLFKQILAERPAAVFIGGDLLPSPLKKLTTSTGNIEYKSFINDFLVEELKKIKETLGKHYPSVFVILGNDDGRMEETTMLEATSQGVWLYCHNRSIPWRNFTVYGYSYIPPSPFRLKDWERYDVSRYVDPGCTAPAEGILSVPVPEYQLKWATIAEDLETLTVDKNLENAIFLFHSPPYKSRLDRAALDGKMIEYVPLEVHVGSIAIRRFIEERQPLITLHGHVHESSRLTGSWRERFNQTESFNASHDGPELSLIRFDPNCPEKATRELIPL
ncbi:MAG TPA: metallophosphoesterase [Candidatus Kapabacteria bacterium]|nr:metallophosphoesterase [Candidatus Kapabacteria bacterium]